MSNASFSESDPRYHSKNIRRMLDDVSQHVREDVRKVDDPKAQALFETGKSVAGDGRRAAGAVVGDHHVQPPVILLRDAAQGELKCDGGCSRVLRGVRDELARQEVGVPFDLLGQLHRIIDRVHDR